MTMVSQGLSTFEVSGEEYAIRRYPEDPGATKRPVVVLVHGVDGVVGASGDQIRQFAEQLAADGLLAVVPEYFGKDEDGDALPLPELFSKRVARVDRYAPRVAAAVELALKQTDADGKRLGLIGFSLGGGLALGYAESAPGRVGAVVDFFGFIANQDIYKNANKLPPTLVLHNSKDQIVGLKYSEDLLEVLKAAGVENDHHFYDDANPDRGNHPFRPAGAADVDSRARAAGWLRDHLRS
jgi:dienelactone hydrolase